MESTNIVNIKVHRLLDNFQINYQTVPGYLWQPKLAYKESDSLKYGMKLLYNSSNLCDLSAFSGNASMEYRRQQQESIFLCCQHEKSSFTKTDIFFLWGQEQRLSSWLKNSICSNCQFFLDSNRTTERQIPICIYISSSNIGALQHLLKVFNGYSRYNE
jgi:hypothetical protein